jgi:hypothetical protein
MICPDGRGERIIIQIMFYNQLGIVKPNESNNHH